MKQKVKVKIKKQGAPIVNINHAIAIVKYKNIVAICVDMKSKYCQVDYLSSDGGYEYIAIGAGSETIKLKEGVDPMECTKIYFPEYRGWDVFSHTLSRYTLRVCLIKK